MPRGRYGVKTFSFRAKAVGDDGTFSGYGSVFNCIDSYGERVAPGAFTESLKRIEASGRPLPALWQHQSTAPIGSYDKLAEDETGLHVEGRLLIDDIPEARKAYVLMRERIVSGLSIGYYVEADSWSEKEKVLTLTKLDLVEISVVTFPACPEARIDEVKSLLAHGALPPIREFETFLREHGLSRRAAATITDRGYRQLLLNRGELDASDDHSQGDLGASIDGDITQSIRSVSLGAYRFAPHTELVT